MVINKDINKRLRTIKATLASGDNAANLVTFTIDANAIKTGATNKEFVSHIEVVTAAGVQKTGWSKNYKTSGVSAGMLDLSKGSLTFATGDVITIIGTYLTQV